MSCLGSCRRTASRVAWCLFTIISTIFVTLYLGACATDQQADVDLYRDAYTPDVTASSESTVAPLSLEQALACTVLRNERLAVAGERHVQALAEQQRRGAALLPTLDFGAVLNAHDGEDSGGRRTTFDAGPVAQYDLLTGMSDFADVESAEFDADVVRWLLLDLREALLLETAQTYYTAWAADRLIEVLESSVRLQEERLRDVQARNEVGLARPLDVAQIEAQVSLTRATLLEAQQVSRNARTALALLTDEPIAGRTLSDGWTPPVLPSRESLLAASAAHRLDLRAAEDSVRSARRSVDAEIGRYAPSVSVNLEYFLTRQSIPAERDWLAVLTVQIPIFSAGRIEADVRAAWSRFRESLLELSLARRTVTADVEQAHQRVQSVAARVDEFRHLVVLAGETLRQAEGSYSAGLGTNLERLVAQDSLLSAQLELARVEAERKIAALALLRAVGTLGEGTLGLPPPPEPSTEPLPTSPFIRLAAPPGAATAGIANVHSNGAA